MSHNDIVWNESIKSKKQLCFRNIIAWEWIEYIFCVFSTEEIKEKLWETLRTQRADGIPTTDIKRNASDLLEQIIAEKNQPKNEIPELPTDEIPEQSIGGIPGQLIFDKLFPRKQRSHLIHQTTNTIQK